MPAKYWDAYLQVFEANWNSKTNRWFDQFKQVTAIFLLPSKNLQIYGHVIFSILTLPVFVVQLKVH